MTTELENIFEQNTLQQSLVYQFQSLRIYSAFMTLTGTALPL